MDTVSPSMFDTKFTQVIIQPLKQSNSIQILVLWQFKAMILMLVIRSSEHFSEVPVTNTDNFTQHLHIYELLMSTWFQLCISWNLIILQCSTCSKVFELLYLISWFMGVISKQCNKYANIQHGAEFTHLFLSFWLFQSALISQFLFC